MTKDLDQAQIDFGREGYDVGAIILESVADSMALGSRRTAVYRHAKYCTQWCASGATAGGESIAMSAQLDRVMKKLSAGLGDASSESEAKP